MKTTLYHIALCSYGNSCGGGDIFLSNVIPRLARRFKSVTYLGFNRFFDRWPEQGMINVNLLRKNIQRNQGNIEIGLFYFVLFIKSLKYLKPVDNGRRVIISHSDAWPDALFAFLFKLLNKRVTWIAISHLILPNPFKGYKNVYRNRIKLPSIVDIYQWLNQRFFFLLQKKADLLIGINSKDRDYLLAKNRRVFIVKHGREYTAETELPGEDKIYDICFMGRFFKQKGIDEIPDILDNLRKINDRMLTVLFIGRKNQYARWLEEKLQHLPYKIIFAGFTTGEEKFRLLKQSRVMILPSYFESFAIVYLDAISVGVPVIEYDLPCFIDHRRGAVKVPFGDNRAFAGAVNELLTDGDAYRKIAAEGYRYSREFSWDKTAASMERQIERVTGIASEERDFHG